MSRVVRFDTSAVNQLLEEHCVDTNPERRTQQQADENPSGGTTPVVNAGVESRRRHARHGCDSTVPPKRNLRISGLIRWHRATCHAQSDATNAPGVSVFMLSCLRTAMRSRIGSAPDETPICPDCRLRTTRLLHMRTVQFGQS